MSIFGIRKTLPLVVCLLTLFSSVCDSAILVVTNNSDDVNGTVSGTAELIANPGPDGISLREAILAVNNNAGPHQITVVSTLSGSKIILQSPLPEITQDSISLIGTDGFSELPGVTVSGPSGTQDFRLFQVSGSNFTLARFRLTGSRGTGGGILTFRSASSSVLKDIRIEDNIFTNKGIKDSGNCITIGNENGTVNSRIKNVTIARNQFIGFVGDIAVIGTGTSGKNGRFSNLIISGNTFINNSFPVEIGVGSDPEDGITSGIKIVDNIFQKSFQTITLGAISKSPNSPATGNIFRNILISGNLISQSKNPAIIFQAGVSLGGSAVQNAILNVRIENNILEKNHVCAVCLSGGSGSEARENRLEGVAIVNNTILNLEFAGISMIADSMGATNNILAGVEILNSIFDGPGGEFGSGVSPSLVQHCITSQAGFAGSNGNFSADPEFVNPRSGDYHLKGSSPAIDAGVSANGARRDFECSPRSGPVDIGAFEFGGVIGSRLSLSRIGKGKTKATPGKTRCYRKGPFFYPIGTTVTITAVPSAGFQFSGWLGDSDCADGNLTMDSDKQCVSVFSPIN